MSSSPQVRHRRSIRLRGYDYSLAGAYFVTLVAAGRLNLFGEIINGETDLSQPGEIIWRTWKRLPAFFPIELDEWTIMPNHLHAIIWIMEEDKGEALREEEIRNASTLRQPNGTISRSLGAVIQNFKSISTRKISQWKRNSVGAKHSLLRPMEMKNIR